eukprot:5973232-Pleurochrysis_carterae.AAC.1
MNALCVCALACFDAPRSDPAHACACILERVCWRRVRVQDARGDSTPIVALSGQVPTSAVGTDAFQVRRRRSCHREYYPPPLALAH